MKISQIRILVLTILFSVASIFSIFSTSSSALSVAKKGEDAIVRSAPSSLANAWQAYCETLRQALLHPTSSSSIQAGGGGVETMLTSPQGEQVLLVNKVNQLGAQYEPEDLVVPAVRFPFTEELEKKKLREPAARALEQLFQAAEQEGIILYAVSGYRSYQRQDVIFQANVNAKGFEAANRVSAQPGQSEHQTGLAMDVSAASVHFGLEEAFAETAEGEWLAEQAHHYGFIIRYPKGKEHLTGYQYEPWHIRYVGVELAQVIYEKDLTMEEYLASQVMAQHLVQVLKSIAIPLK